MRTFEVETEPREGDILLVSAAGIEHLGILERTARGFRVAVRWSGRTEKLPLAEVEVLGVAVEQHRSVRAA